MIWYLFILPLKFFVRLNFLLAHLLENTLREEKKKIMTSPRKQSQNILSTMWLATFVGHKSPCLSVTEGPMAIITSQINIQDIGRISACAATWPWMMVIFSPWSFWNAVLLYSVFVPIVRNGTWPWLKIFVPSNVSFDVLLHKWKNPERKGLMALCFFIVWLANLKLTVRYLLLVNSPVTSIIFFFFFLQSCQTRGKEPHFPAICTAYDAAGGAPATICAFCAPAAASATLVG